MSAFKTPPPSSPQSIKFPTYPVMFVTTTLTDGPEYEVRCSCGTKFWANSETGENLVDVNGQKKEACPYCYAMAGMTRERHIVGLRMIREVLQLVQFSKFDHPSVSAWRNADAGKVEALINNAMRWKFLTQIGADVFQISEPLDGLQTHQRFPSLPKDPDLNTHVFIPPNYPNAVADPAIWGRIPLDQDPPLTEAERRALEDEHG